MKRIMDLKIPTLAAYNGAALGGGLEIGLYCDYRTVSKAVPAIAFPECFLGTGSRLGRMHSDSSAHRPG